MPFHIAFFIHVTGLLPTHSIIIGDWRCQWQHLGTVVQSCVLSERLVAVCVLVESRPVEWVAFCVILMPRVVPVGDAVLHVLACRHVWAVHLLAVVHHARCTALAYLLQVFPDHLQQFWVREQVVFRVITCLMTGCLCEMSSHVFWIILWIRTYLKEVLVWFDDFLKFVNELICSFDCCIGSGIFGERDAWAVLLAEDVGDAGFFIALVRLLDSRKRIALIRKQFLTLIFQLLLFSFIHPTIFLLIQSIFFHLIPSIQGALHFQQGNSPVGICLKHIS